MDTYQKVPNVDTGNSADDNEVNCKFDEIGMRTRKISVLAKIRVIGMVRVSNFFAIVFSHLFNPADEGQRTNVVAHRLKAFGLIVLCAGLGAVTFLSGTFDIDGFMKAANASISASDVQVNKDGKLKLFDATSK
jgi:hypothetical protein